KCSVDLKNWFQSGKLEGFVTPPATLTFRNDGNCSFYRIADQMFLWLTSPAPESYGPGSGPYVFDSAVFYDVSPFNAQKQRNLTINSKTHIKDVSVSITQLGSRGSRVVFDENGRMYDIAPVQQNESKNPSVRDRSGKVVEIARTLVAPDGGPLFLDEA